MALDFGNITAEKRAKTVVDELLMDIAQFLRMEDYVPDGTGLAINNNSGEEGVLSFKDKKGKHIRITIEQIPMRDR
jgi:hypothetical protein